MKKLGPCLKALWDMSAPVRWRMAVSVAIGPAIGLFAGVLALQLGSIVFANWWDAYSQVKAQNILRKSLFGHVMKSRWDGRERFLSGDTVNRLEEDIRVVSELITDRIPGMLITLVQLIAASVYMMILAPNLLWLLLILMCSTLLKAGIAAEANGDAKKALSFYQTIKDQWSNAPEAMEIDKYITRIETAE